MERLNLLLVLNLGLLLAGCPGDDSTDEGGDTGTAGDSTTMNNPGTTEAVDSSGDPGSSSGDPGSSSGDPGSSSGDPGSSSGEPESTGDSTTGEPALSFANDVYPIIEANCSCHVDGGPGGLEMPDAGTAYGNLVDVPSNNAANAQDRVEPGDPDASFLWHKLNGTLAGGEGDPMPDGGPQLGAGDLGTVEQWILGGAQP
jgi:hypothetical protein